MWGEEWITWNENKAGKNSEDRKWERVSNRVASKSCVNRTTYFLNINV